MVFSRLHSTDVRQAAGQNVNWRGFASVRKRGDERAEFSLSGCFNPCAHAGADNSVLILYARHRLYCFRLGQMWALSAIHSTFTLSLPATNFAQFRQYDSSRANIPATGRRSKCGLGDFADINLKRCADFTMRSLFAELFCD